MILTHQITQHCRFFTNL